MDLKQAFLKLPKSFDAEKLAAEVRALPLSAWVPHPGNYPGNDAVLLVSPEGKTDNGFTGQMAPTEHLRSCPYIAEVMAEIGAVWGRSRLMGLAAGANVLRHVDVHYHWRMHTRIHIPVITSDKVIFTCGNESIHMAAGECWVFDSFQMHSVRNGGAEKRVHLVLDTVGGEALWDLLDQAQDPARVRPIRTTKPSELRFERVDTERVMTPWEVRAHIEFLRGRAEDPKLKAVFWRLERFAATWRAIWAEYAGSEEGIPAYRRAIAEIQQELLSSGDGNLQLPNQVPISRALAELVFQVALPTEIARPAFGSIRPDQRLAS
jgi:hypothetical protein